MFFLRHKKRLADTGFFRGFVDSHSHILPGVDDGIKTIEESLEVLAHFDSLGVKKVRLTPHVMNGVEHWEDVLQAFDTLRRRYTGEIALKLGAMRYSDYCELKNKDCLLQLNLLSLSGYYGKQVMKKAESLLEKGMYNMVGTDLHNLETFRKWIENVRLTDKQTREIMSLR